MHPQRRPNRDRPESRKWGGSDKCRSAIVRQHPPRLAVTPCFVYPLWSHGRGLRNRNHLVRAAALTIVRMPVRMSSGNSGQASLRVARAGSIVDTAPDCAPRGFQDTVFFRGLATGFDSHTLPPINLDHASTWSAAMQPRSLTAPDVETGQALQWVHKNAVLRDTH
jgi:hypothetical protein